MDFNINNFPEGVNVNVRYLDGMDWLTNSKPKGSLMMFSTYNTPVRYFDWWTIDTSELSSIRQNDYEYTCTFGWNPHETELTLSMPNVTSLKYFLLDFEGGVSGATLRIKDLDKVTDFYYALNGEGLNTVILEGKSTSFSAGYPMRFGTVTNFYFNFDCTNLASNTTMFSSNNTIKFFNGLPNVKNSQTGSYGINVCQYLTYESCISIMENLYDFTGNGETPTSSQGKLKVHANFLNRVGDEISIATSKGWVITT